MTEKGNAHALIINTCFNNSPSSNMSYTNQLEIRISIINEKIDKMKPILIAEKMISFPSFCIFLPKFSDTYFITPLSNPAFPITSAKRIIAFARE